MYYYWIDGRIEDIEKIASKYGLQGKIVSRNEGYAMLLKSVIDENEPVDIIYKEKIEDE